MALMKWEPEVRELEPLRGLRHEVDRLFDEFVRGSPLRQMTRWFTPLEGSYAPNVDLEETDQEFVLSAEVPGIRKDQLEVNITEGRVTLKGERKEREHARNVMFHCKELAYGAFERVMELPAPVVPDKAVAKMEDGLLTLTLPKAEAAKRQMVKVKIE
jgi:HSP20 family protein